MDFNISVNDLVHDPVGETSKNEKCITLALAKRFISCWDNNVVELGSVLPFYGYSTHTILDDTEIDIPSGVIDNNIESYDFSGKNVISLNFLDNRTNYIALVDKINKNSNCFLLSLSYNDDLKEYIMSENLPYFSYNKNKENNRWTYSDSIEDSTDGDIVFIYKNL